MPGEAFGWTNVSGNQLPGGLGPNMHSIFLQAGLPIVWANATAISGGSASSPGWQASFSSLASAGKVAYLIPARDGLAAWYFTIELFFPFSPPINLSFIEVQVGRGWDSGTNTLTGVESSVKISDINAFTASVTQFVSASRDGFVICQPTATNIIGRWMVHVERCRNTSDAVTADLGLHVWTTGNGSLTGLVSEGSGQTAFYRRFKPVAGNTPWRNTLLLKIADGSYSTGAVDRDDATGFTIRGPYLHSGADPYIPRLIHFVSLADAGAGSSQSISRDGATRVYRAFDISGYGDGRLLMAESA